METATAICVGIVGTHSLEDQESRPVSGVNDGMDER